MKFRTFTFFLSALFQILICSSLLSQVSIEFPQAPQQVNVCEADSLSFFRFSIEGSPTAVDSFYIAMPSGIHYVPGSAQVISSSGLSLVELNISNPSRPQFELDRSNLESGEFIEFTISKTGDCGAVQYSVGGNLAHDTLGIWSDTVITVGVSTNYNIVYGSLFTSYVHSNDTIVQDLPSTVCREIRIVNGGTGYLSKLQHRVNPGSDLENYELNYQGTPLVPRDTIDGELIYDFDLSTAPFAGTFGMEDTVLQNGEFLVIEECFSVTTCDFSDGSVTHQSFWGCGGELCQTGNFIIGSVDLNFSQPALRSDIDSLDNIVCMDGQDRGYIRMRVWNEGVGPAVLDEIMLSANGANTALDIDGFSVVDETGTDISSFFPNEAGSGNTSCGSGTTNFTVSNDDFETSYQLHPDDTIIIEMFYLLCCPGPETCGAYTLSNPLIRVRGTDLCGDNSQVQTRNSGTGGTASATDPIVSGNSVLSEGQVSEFCAEYPNYQFLNVGDSDSSYVTFMVELPDDGGLGFNNPMNSSFSIGGNSIPIESIMEVGDSLLIHVLLSDVENQPAAPIKVCFELIAICQDGPGGMTSLNLGQSANINCDPLCFIKLNCSTHDVLLLGCDVGDCDVTGGGRINSYDVERISYGYEDTNGDRNWDDFVRADASNINLKRAMVGDTIRHQSQLGFTNGSITEWAGGYYRETYTGDVEALFCPDTAWIEISSGTNNYVIGGIVPVMIQNGFEYDLSIDALSELPGGESLPSGFTFSSSDDINLTTQYAFCKENAPDWYSVQPGVYRPDKERQNVIFTGSFAAVPASDAGSEYACNEAFDEMLLLGAALSVEIKNGGFSGSGCDRDFRYLIEIEQNIGGVLSGYSGTFDFFPNEFRPLYIPDSIVVEIPNDVTFKNAWLVTQQIENSPPPAHGEQVDHDIPPAQITETATSVILKVRDVHDAFGGNLFPYDEENADLRYYISFQRSCEAPRSVTTDVSIAYTTPICPEDDFETIEENLTTGTNTDLYDIDYIQTPLSKPADNDNTCFTLQIRPRGGNLSYTWLQFPENDSVAILSVSEGGMVLTAQGNGIYELGAHSGNSTRTISICVDLNSCNQGDFEVLHGWSCNGYPDESNQENCTYETLKYTVETVESELQFDLITQPSNSTPGNTPDFCAPLLYEVLVNSANAGSVLNPSIDITVPTGFEIDDIVVQYPNGSNPESLLSTTVVNGNIMSVDLTEHSLLVDSLPGTATVLTPANRQILLQIFGHTSCDFTSGSQVFFTVFGERPCGGPVAGNGIRRASDRLFINDLLPYQANPIIELDVDQGITCSIATPINVTYQIEEGEFTGLDSGLLILSPGMDFVPGSLICNTMNSSACPQIERVEEDPDSPGGTLIYFSYDGAILPEGETINFTFEVMAQEGTECGQQVNIQVENYVTVDGLMCGDVVCSDGVTGITGVDTLELEVIHPNLNFNDLTANTISGSSFLEYTGTISVSQRALSEHDSLYVIIYCADSNGEPTNAVDSIIINGPLALNGTVDFTGYFPQADCDLANGLVFSVNPIEGCLCSEPLQFLPGEDIEEVVREFDLALTKTVEQPADLNYGDTLVFDIQIFNQGDVLVDSFEISDYIPAGLFYLDSNDNTGWNLEMPGLAKRTVRGPLQPNQDTTIQILLRLDYSSEPDAYLNFAEISEHHNPTDLDDRDSNPDDDPHNDAGGKPESPSDDSIDGDGSGNPGDEDPETDEDDHDPALVKVADLALRKIWRDGFPGSYTYGDTLSMTIQLFNQGNVPTSYIEVTDYLPPGLTFIDDPVLNPGWDGTDPKNPVYTWTNDTLYHGEMTEISISVTLDLVASPDSASWTNYSEISHFRDTAGVELEDVDSTPDNDPTNDAGGQPDSPADDYIGGDGAGEIGDGVDETDEDDHDPLRLQVYDLALQKIVSADNTLPFGYNDTAVFDITVFNQGNEPVQNIEVTDYVPTNTDFASMNDVNIGWDASDPDKPVFTIGGTLLPGADTTISIALILRQEAGVNNWVNYAEISQFEDLDGGNPDDIDSTPDDNPDNDYGAQPLGETDDEISGNAKSSGSPTGNDDPSFDEDDHDVAILDVVDLALIKVIDTLGSEFPLAFGNLIKFDIIIQNQGNVITDSVRVQDYVPAGFDFDPGLTQNIDEGWQADGTALLTRRLDFMEYDTVSMYLTLQPVADPQMDSWINYAEILHVYDTTGNEVGELDYDSSPGSDSEEERSVHPGDDGDDDFMSPHRDSIGSEDDHDPAGVMFLDLALYKQVDSTETIFPVRYGDMIKFNIFVINQEGIMVDSVRVKDYVPEGYIFDPSFPGNQAYGWRADTTAMIEGPVNVGDTVFTSIYLELKQISVPHDRSWVNYSEIFEVWSGGMEIGDMDIDSEPGSDSPEERETYPGHPGDDDVMSISRDEVGSEDDHDPAHVEVFDLALTKTTEVEVGYPDLDVEFEITVYNQGGIPAANIEITDYIPAGLTFDPSLNAGWTGSDPMISYVIGDTLYPGEFIQVPVVLTVTTVLHPDSLVNVAEISAAQDTTGMDREDIDGVFDDDPTNDAGGKPDSPADNYVDGDGSGNPGDGVASTDEDNSDPAKILPCLPVNCHAYINLSFDTDCEIEITADMLLTDNRIAVAAPEFYEVELFYGPGIRIPDNILRPEHVGRTITARVTFLIDACGGGTCETTIVLDKPNACLIRNTLDTTVYCIDPLLALDPFDAAYPKPELVNICNGADLKLEVSPDWIMPVSCDESNDTAEVIFREWTAVTPGGDRCTGVDTIVVLRLPKLTPGAFVDSSDQEFYCEPIANQLDGGLLTRYASWKQPVGLHDYEVPYSKLRGVVYDIPGTIILAGLTKAFDQGPDVYSKYLQNVILRKANGVDSVTIGDIVSGDYMNALIANASEEQRLYGFLSALIEGNENPLAFLLGASLEFYPYLLLQHGDWVLSENGSFEKVTSDWFYSGNGMPPYWFAGGWPSVYGNGSAVTYCDVAGGNDFGCIRIQVPRLIHGVGFDPQICDTICLTPGGVHCGISIEQGNLAGGPGWSGSCPQVRSLDTWITQTCWAETPNLCVEEMAAEESDLITAYDSTAKKVEIRLSQTQTLIDTIGPIFEFYYSTDWDQESILDMIRAGNFPEEAQLWEQMNPTTYHVNSHSCEAEIFVPDVQVVDNCSGIHSIKAMVEVLGGTRSVSLEQSGVEVKVMPTGDTCYVYTFSHLTNPISVPFNGCDGSLMEVRYEAADHCWNQSEWYKYIEVVDDTPPTVIADRGVNVTLNGKTEWVPAETFDEGSWDNCSVDLLLTRRSDWLECVNVCGAPGPHANEAGQYDSWIDILDDLGIRRSDAQAAANGSVLHADEVNAGITIDDISVFLSQGEIEAYFFHQLVWLWEDDQNCGSQVVHAWIFALASAIAENCSTADEHGNGLSIQDLEYIFDNLFGSAGYGNELALMGGGWAQMAPFKCVDACEAVSVELMVMDQCCNWGIGWGDALVEDKGSTRIHKSLVDLDIDCKAYNIFYKDLVEAAAALGENGSVIDTTGVFTAMDDAFGSYVISWINNQGLATDLDGNLLPDDALTFDYRNVSCVEKSESEKVAVENHDGTIDWITEISKTTYLDTSILTGTNGLIAANCSARVVQDIWVDLDECGQGTITRRFFISSGCSDSDQIREVEQVITIGSACGLRESMFDLPDPAGTVDSPICISESLMSINQNGQLPAEIGAVTLKPHLEGLWCSALAFGTDVKEFDIEGIPEMKKYRITWSAKDWCATNSGSGSEFEYVQEVIARIDEECGGTNSDTTGNSIVSGRIQTALNSPLENVAVKAIADRQAPLSITTNSAGEFDFEIRNGTQVSVVPGMNTKFSEGITTADLIDIQRHILQKSRLEDPYQLLAADVNGNGVIDGLDVIELRKVVLDPKRKFANNTSWRFFESTTGKEVYNVPVLEEDHTVQFIGTKIGDVNMSSDPATNNRNSTGRLELNVADRVLEGGEIYRLDVRSDNFEQIRGLQYTMQYSTAHIEVQSIEPGVLHLTEDNYLDFTSGTIPGVPTETGLLTASWSEASEVSVSPEEVLFTIVVKAKNPVALRDVISLNHRVTRTEAYAASGELYDVALDFNASISGEQGFALYQNRPNPYNMETVIGFILPESSTATMTIYTVTGKLIKRIEGDYSAGYHELRVSAKDLGTTGVLYYQLDTDRYTATKKMIVVD